MPITLPDLGTPRAVLSGWYVQPGERVYEGDRVAEVRLPGATFDVPSPATGVLAERLVLVNDSVAAGQSLGSVEADE